MNLRGRKILAFFQKKKGLKNKRVIIFLIFLTCLSIFFRFYNFSHLVYWMVDEERDAFIIKGILVDKHFTLIGPAVPGGLYLGPGYFYITSVIYFFSHLNPFGTAAMASTLGVLSNILLFYVARKLFNQKTAVFASLIYCVSYLVVVYNRTWWPLTFTPTVSLVTYLSLYQIITTKNLKWVITLSFALIVGIQADPSNFSTILLTILFWIIYRLPIRNKYVAGAVFLFFFSHLPLAIFDLRHDFLNLRHFLQFFSFGTKGAGFQPLEATVGIKTIPQVLSRFIYVSNHPDTSAQISPGFYYVNLKIAQIPQTVLFTSIVVLAWFFKIFFSQAGDKNNLGIKIIGSHVVIAAIGIVFYNIFFPGYTEEWFFQVLFPTFAIILGIILTNLARWKVAAPLAWLALIGYILANTITLFGTRNSYNLADKSEAVKWAISEIKGEPFALNSIGKFFGFGGYRYLFYLYGHEPVQSYTDSVYEGWLYPKNTSMQTPSKKVLIVNRDFYLDSHIERVYQDNLAKSVGHRKFGRIEVLILEFQKNE